MQMPWCRCAGSSAPAVRNSSPRQTSGGGFRLAGAVPGRDDWLQHVLVASGYNLATMAACSLVTALQKPLADSVWFASAAAPPPFVTASPRPTFAMSAACPSAGAVFPRNLSTLCLSRPHACCLPCGRQARRLGLHSANQLLMATERAAHLRRAPAHRGLSGGLDFSPGE